VGRRPQGPRDLQGRQEPATRRPSQDQNADWFAREKAAFELARLAPGDKGAALELAKAFKVRNPDARVSMALLVPACSRARSAPNAPPPSTTS
jgi:hypothetical protein